MNLQKNTVAAIRFYESSRPQKVRNGWGKYILSDGEFCMPVKRNYWPAPGEAVFSLTTRDGKTACQLISLSPADKYCLRSDTPLMWTVTDSFHGISLSFLQGMLDKSKAAVAHTPIAESESKHMQRWIRDIEDWLCSTHSLLIYADAEYITSAIEKIQKENYWILLSEILGDVSHTSAIANSAELYAKAEKYLSARGIFDQFSFMEALRSLTDEESLEVIRFVECYLAYQTYQSASAWSKGMLAYPSHIREISESR